jgi:hypothetical protein
MLGATVAVAPAIIAGVVIGGVVYYFYHRQHA